MTDQSLRRIVRSRPVEISRLVRHVKSLAGDIGERNVFHPAALAAAADYIESCWRQQGHVVDRQWYETHDVRCANLQVTLRGKNNAARILLIGAHYDSARGSPGANDNASGVAALLELSYLLRGIDLPITVRLVAFVNEEPPFFMSKNQGSMVYARAAKARGDDIGLMVALDELAFYSNAAGSQYYPPPLGFFYPKQGNFIALVSNLRSRKFMLRFARAFQSVSDFPLEHIATLALAPGVSWSDHRSFWKNGYPAFMVTDTAFYRYRQHHKPTDTPDKLNYPAFSQVVRGLHNTFCEVAGEPLLIGSGLE